MPFFLALVPHDMCLYARLCLLVLTSAPLLPVSMTLVKNAYVPLMEYLGGYGHPA
jgi:hypothetical protein